MLLHFLLVCGFAVASSDTEVSEAVLKHRHANNLRGIPSADRDLSGVGRNPVYNREMLGEGLDHPWLTPRSTSGKQVRL